MSILAPHLLLFLDSCPTFTKPNLGEMLGMANYYSARSAIQSLAFAIVPNPYFQCCPDWMCLSGTHCAQALIFAGAPSSANWPSSGCKSCSPAHSCTPAWTCNCAAQIQVHFWPCGSATTQIRQRWARKGPRPRLDPKMGFQICS